MDAAAAPTPDVVEMPHGNLVKHILDNTKYEDPDFVAASIIAARYDDPKVPDDIYAILNGTKS